MFVSPSVFHNDQVFSFLDQRSCRPLDIFWVDVQGLVVLFTFSGIMFSNGALMFFHLFVQDASRPPTTTSAKVITDLTWFRWFLHILKLAMEKNPLRANLCTITDSFFFFWNRHRRNICFFSPQNSQRFDAGRQKVTALVVDNGSGMSFPGFAGFSPLALCSRRSPAGRHAHAEKCADSSGEHFY